MLANIKTVKIAQRHGHLIQETTIIAIVENIKDRWLVTYKITRFKESESMFTNGIKSEK